MKNKTWTLAKWGSRKLWMSVFANVMMWAAYELAMRHLYQIPAEKVGAFVALTQTILCGITAVSAAYVGVTGLIQMRHGVESGVAQTLSQAVEMARGECDGKQESAAKGEGSCHE